MFQLAEGFPAFDSFSDGHLLAVDLSERQIERRFAARSRRMGKDVQRRREHRATAPIRKRIGWIIQKFRAGIGPCARPGQQIPLEFESIMRSEEHTSELQSLMRISYAVFCVTNTLTNHSNTP